MEDMTPEYIMLGDVVRLAILTAPLEPGQFRAWAPQWNGVEAFGCSARAAALELQYLFEKKMAEGKTPTLYVSP